MVHEEGSPGTGLAGYLLQLDEGKLHVCALGDLIFIPGGEEEERREEGEREAVQLDVVGAWGLVNPPWVWIRASAVSSFGTLCQSEKSGPSFGWIEPLSSMTQALSPMVPQCWLWGNRQTCSLF